jgi:hypothetical protein
MSVARLALALQRRCVEAYVGQGMNLTVEQVLAQVLLEGKITRVTPYVTDVLEMRRYTHNWAVAKAVFLQLDAASRKKGLAWAMDRWREEWETYAE